MECYFLKVDSSTTATQKILTLVTTEINDDWLERIAKFNNPRVYREIYKYDKFDDLFEYIGLVPLSGDGDARFYKAKKPIKNCSNIIAIVNTREIQGNASCVIWHEDSGRYYKYLIQEKDFDNVLVNTNTYRNPNWMTLTQAKSEIIR